MVAPPKRSHGPKFALRTLSRLILIPALPFFWCLTPSPASKYLNARYVYVFNNASGLLLSWLKKVLIAYEVYARNTHQVRITSIPRSGSSELLLLLCVLYTCRCRYISNSLFLNQFAPLQAHSNSYSAGSFTRIIYYYRHSWLITAPIKIAACCYMSKI